MLHFYLFIYLQNFFEGRSSLMNVSTHQKLGVDSCGSDGFQWLQRPFRNGEIWSCLRGSMPSPRRSWWPQQQHCVALLCERRLNLSRLFLAAFLMSSNSASCFRCWMLAEVLSAFSYLKLLNNFVSLIVLLISIPLLTISITMFWF